ncbi:unnamed protein product [Callosobruchus maculatus]|uniref:Tafazzin family protein n=1 Tax=Callosobruchus maculatus TaxID=64391 RepID=A0A653DC99_CALMS|nr:unnamed protein product [Callosobruchus maculatus]
MTKKMGYNIDWIIPNLRCPSTLWGIASSITMTAVGLFTKLLIRNSLLNNTKVHNEQVMTRIIHNRENNIPLITVSNHHSCFDDPGIWGTLNIRTLLSPSKMRWSLTAHDICFTTAPHAVFFSLGKCIPVIRGAGVYQDAVDFCIEKLAEGAWVHIFPEGK